MGSDVEKSAAAAGYLHGYSREEQDRLYEQARFLENKVYEKVDFSGCTSILEVGCGVGAQTEILLERFPQLRISGIDASPAQIRRAQERLGVAISSGKVKLDTGDAGALPYPENHFDGAFICFFLEHVSSPLKVLHEVRRALKPGGIVYCTEVLNATFFLHPYSPATLKYWFAFNDHQWSLGGDPFVGAKLGNLLMGAGFQNITTNLLCLHYDNRTPKLRAQMIDYWTRLLLSGTPGLLEAGKITDGDVASMRDELQRLKQDPDAVFFYSGIQARGQAF